MWENHGSPQTAENHYERRIITMESTEATTSCAPSSPRGGYNGGNDLSTLSLSVSIHSYALYTYNYKKVFNHINCFALSHIYTHMTFGLFTHVAPRGSLEHIHICVPSNRSGGSPPGLRSSSSR